jgi:hypothetical protein
MFTRGKTDPGNQAAPMTERHVVIYTSPEAKAAMKLCQHLAQIGIHAQLLGLSTAARPDASATNQVQVVVDENDQLVAQQIALEFDRPELHHGCAIVDVLVDDRDPGTIDAWPTCPSCGKKRHTMCPICETAGSDFPPADSISGDDETELEGTDDPGDPLGRRPLLCPMCDEPFVPNYLRECEWCNFDFGYGLEKPFEFDDSLEPVNWRVGVLIAGLLALAGLLVFYMNVLMQQK